MGEKVKVSIEQIFVVMLLSRLFITLTDIPPIIGSMEVTDYLFRVLFFILLVFISAIPVYLTVKNDTNANILDRCVCISPIFGKVVAFIYGITFIYVIIATMARFDMFATSIIFPKTNFTGFLVIIILACMFAAILGIESISRSSTFIFVVFLVSFLAVVFSVYKKVDFLNFSPIFYNGAGSTIKAAFISMPRTFELAAVLMLMSKIKGNIKKGMTFWIIGMGLFQTVIIFLMVGVMGDYMKTQLIPAYTLSVVAEYGFLQRMDVLLTSTWILCVYIKVSVMIYLFKDCMKTLISDKYDNLYIIVSSIIVSVITLFLNPKAYSINYLLNPIIPLVLYSLTVIAIPCIVLISEKVKDVKNYEK